jgi:hypothetical protein
VQTAQFEVIETLGCFTASGQDVLSLLIVESWAVTLPLISLVFYWRKSALIWPYIHQLLIHVLNNKARIIWRFYHHSKQTNELLSSECSVGRDKFFRVLIIGCIDILGTLPLGLLDVIPTSILLYRLKAPFYVGWRYTHADWQPKSIKYTRSPHRNIFIGFEQFANPWSDVVMGFLIFALFGLTEDARVAYRQGFSRIAGLFGLRCSTRKDRPVSNIAFKSKDAESDAVAFRYAVASSELCFRLI